MRENSNEPFVRNAWYIAAWPEELDDGAIVARTILGEPLVIFRDADGKAAALEDRCCHRGAPLSQGWMGDKGIICGYHGLTFDGSGACVEIPGQDNIPAQTRVDAYPIVEHQQIIWIWMGDAAADESKIVDYPYHDKPEKWPHKKATFTINANYMMMMDNLMDLSHLAYVHRKTIGGSPQAHAAAENSVTETETGCVYERWMMNSPPPPTYVKAVGFEGQIDRWHHFEYIAPSTVIQNNGAIDAGKGARENRDQPGLQFQIIHHATPETETSFHYFFSLANGYRQTEPAATEQLFTESYPTFLEDKVILEAQQANIERQPERKLVAIQNDRAVFAARRAIKKMIEAEQAGKAAAE